VAALLAASVAAFAPGAAGDELGEYEAKVQLLERVTRFVTWPEGALGPGAAPIRGCIVGERPLGAKLAELAPALRIQGHPLVAVRVRDLAELDGCHLVLLATADGSDVRRVIARTEERPILTVADTHGFAERGVLLNLVLLDERLGFEVNTGAARRSGLGFPSRLLKLARVVEAER
jgi:hypothetical protein